jgi:hypothetical protein
MPTPFMHMALARRLLADPALPTSAREFLSAHWGAFLLGSIAPDARVTGGVDRVSTHFFDYTPIIDPPPAKAMISQHPDLMRSVINNDAQTAFVAGYLGHLSMDEVWSTALLMPHFLHGGDWADKRTKFLVLHLLLADLDQRDIQFLPADYYDSLMQPAPHRWLPFMPDENLRIWRDTIAAQIAPNGYSRTNEILGQRVGLPESEITALLADQAEMDRLTWANVPRDMLAQVEEMMYAAVYATVIAYLDETL